MNGSSCGRIGNRLQRSRLLLLLLACSLSWHTLLQHHHDVALLGSVAAGKRQGRFRVGLTERHAHDDSADVMAANRLLHAQMSVRDINASIAFYKALGMGVLSYSERSNGA